MPLTTPLRAPILPTLLVCGLLAAPTLARADAPADLDTFLVVRAGTVPIILSAPHGGKLAVPDLPPRTGRSAAKFVTVLDTNTFELTERLAAAVEKALGGRPYVVMARFERKQLDANRPPEDAYEDPRAKPYYDAYHKALKAHCDEVRKTWGRGLLLDMHGQAAEAGTLFRGTRKLTTCDGLRTRFGMAAVTGPKSVLGALAARGYAVVPPADAPADAPERPSFTGGHIVGTYGSGNGTNIDALQLEFGADARAARALDRTATDLAAALKLFAQEYLPTEKLP